MIHSPQTKKILIIAGLAVVVLVVGFAIYFFFFRSIFEPTGNGNTNGNTNNTNDLNRLPNINGNRNVNVNTNGNTNSVSTLPDISDVADGGPTKVTPIINSRTKDGAPTSDGTGYVYYDPATYKFYKVLANGERVEISSKEFYDVQSIAWSPDRQRAILKYPDGSNLYYNFSDGLSVTLPKEIQEPEFTATGNKIAYKFIGEQEGQQWLAVSNPDGSEQQLFQALGDRASRVDVNWSPDGQVAGIYREGTGLDEEEIYFIGQHGENFKSFTAKGSGFTSAWSPQGDKLLYSVYSAETDYKPTLSIVDARGDAVGLNNTALDLNTWPDKCTFGGTALYCAVPTDLATGAGLSRDSAVMANDNFYSIDLATGQKTLLAIPYNGPDDIGYSADGLYLSPGEDALYFHNAKNDKLEKITLK